MTEVKLNFREMSDKELRVAVEDIIRRSTSADEVKLLIQESLEYPYDPVVDMLLSDKHKHQKMACVRMWNKDGKGLLI